MGATATPPAGADCAPLQSLVEQAHVEASALDANRKVSPAPCRWPYASVEPPTARSDAVSALQKGQAAAVLSLRHLTSTAARPLEAAIHEQLIALGVQAGPAIADACGVQAVVASHRAFAHTHRCRHSRPGRTGRWQSSRRPGGIISVRGRGRKGWCAGSLGGGPSGARSCGKACTVPSAARSCGRAVRCHLLTAAAAACLCHASIPHARSRRCMQIRQRQKLLQHLLDRVSAADLAGLRKVDMGAYLSCCLRPPPAPGQGTRAMLTAASAACHSSRRRKAASAWQTIRLRRCIGSG